MKVVVLAGGLGTRLSEETTVKPKPMVEIGGHPILWHILKTYAHWGITDSVICCGYLGHVIKDYFRNYVMQSSDLRVDMRSNEVEVLKQCAEPWRVSLVDTGATTMTGGRIRRVREYVKGGTFCATYGDGVSNVDIPALLSYHREHKALVTLTAVQPPGRFGSLLLEEGSPFVRSFREKPKGDGAYINGGFFVIEPEALEFIDGDDTSFEQEPLMRIANEGKLAAFRHDGFWHSMDTLRDRHNLETLWQSESPPWKVWGP